MTDGYYDHCCLPRHAYNAFVLSPIHFALLNQTGVNTLHQIPRSNHLLFAGGRAVSTPDYPEPLRSSLTDADSLTLQRDQWPRKNVPHPTQVPHVTSAIPEPLQNSMADAEYVNVRRPQQ